MNVTIKRTKTQTGDFVNILPHPQRRGFLVFDRINFSLQRFKVRDPDQYNTGPAPRASSMGKENDRAGTCPTTDNSSVFSIANGGRCGMEGAWLKSIAAVAATSWKWVASFGKTTACLG
ncbi:hypothetical protein ACFQRK_10915 [Parapedobacter sp. GCM10030251]|uniref:hypothetical protein n=1 Tax=Parapedobacter sp. GCM10030251 TaxID=3273419 RepID=UPI00361A0FD0